MLVSEEHLIGALTNLTKGGREFHTTELAAELGNQIGVEVESDVARYWANQLVLKGVLERRKINTRLYVYRKRKGVNLSASITINS